MSREGDQADPKRKYQRRQWPKAVWERGKNGRMKRVELNKLNWNLYALTFGPQTIPPMAQKMSKKIMRLSYKQYKCSLCNNGDMLL